MFQLLISITAIICITLPAKSQDNVSNWLQRMGCEELLASYLENQLDHGSRIEQIRAANQLADVYAILLARSSGKTDSETLQRAIQLFERIPEVGTTDLRVQLYRATYLAAEQILERYRLRISSKQEAEVSIQQLNSVAIELQTLRANLMKRARSSNSRDEKRMQQIGLLTSYLAWSKYYIAWYEGDMGKAKEAAQLFSEILMGEKPSLQSVSLDLKTHDTGARSILGIALCKAIGNDPIGPELWFEELEDPKTWSEVQNAIPLWKFFLLIDSKDWNAVLGTLANSTSLNKTLSNRVAAVHALEDYTDPAAKVLAQTAIANLIEINQLGIVRDIVFTYGEEALNKDGFIAKYIKGDIAFQAGADEYTSDQPTSNPAIAAQFLQAATLFTNALRATDTNDFPTIKSDCYFRTGISLFYASKFSEASFAFQKSSELDSKEQTVWMAIVCLHNVHELSTEQEFTKDALIEFFLKAWPNSKRTSQLMLHKTDINNATIDDVELLLSIPHSSPEYEKAKRQAARSLYAMWQRNDHQHVLVGNRYISLASAILSEDAKDPKNNKLVQRAIVRALRILEISLHSEVKRLQAAENALQTLNSIQQSNSEVLVEYAGEIAYRNLLFLLYTDELQEASALYIQMTESPEYSVWVEHASAIIWNSIQVESETATPLLTYAVGTAILLQHNESEYGTNTLADLATKTAYAAYYLYQSSNEELYKIDLLRIARLLISQRPKTLQILLLNAEVEMNLGNKDTALSQWKMISSGTAPGSDDWLLARYHSINLLSSSSVDKARQLLDQHEILYPDYGGGTTSKLFEQLHLKLRKETSE